jgi:hypothetical protein
MRVRKSGWQIRFASVVAMSGLAVACSTGTDPDIKPTSAHIRVEGTAPAQLQLVVSTEFYEAQDEVTFEIYQVIESADTSFIDVPYDEVLPLSSSGSVVVQLANLEIAPAQVRLRVDLDSGQEPYDRTATMSDGGRLRYVFVFLQRVIG